MGKISRQLSFFSIDLLLRFQKIIARSEPIVVFLYSFFFIVTFQ